jgi:hypothetical protein
VKKLGVWWVFGDVADFKLNNPVDGIKGLSKKVRLIIPPPTESFSVLNKGGRGFSGKFSALGATDSFRNSSIHSALYQPGNLVKVIAPTFLVLGGN